MRNKAKSQPNIIQKAFSSMQNLISNFIPGKETSGEEFIAAFKQKFPNIKPWNFMSGDIEEVP